MKKFAAVLLVAGALASNAFAHHPAQYEDAGINIPDVALHLDMDF